MMKPDRLQQMETRPLFLKFKTQEKQSLDGSEKEG